MSYVYVWHVVLRSMTMYPFLHQITFVFKLKFHTEELLEILDYLCVQAS